MVVGKGESFLEGECCGGVVEGDGRGEEGMERMVVFLPFLLSLLRRVVRVIGDERECVVVVGESESGWGMSESEEGWRYLWMFRVFFLPVGFRWCSFWYSSRISWAWGKNWASISHEFSSWSYPFHLV